MIRSLAIISIIILALCQLAVIAGAIIGFYGVWPGHWLDRLIPLSSEIEYVLLFNALVLVAVIVLVAGKMAGIELPGGMKMWMWFIVIGIVMWLSLLG